jgi:hypothetical protein
MRHSCAANCHELSTSPTRRCLALCNAIATCSDAILAATQIALTTPPDSRSPRRPSPCYLGRPGDQTQMAPARRSNLHRLIRA